MIVKCMKNYGSDGNLKKNKEYEVEYKSCDCYKLKGVNGYWSFIRFQNIKNNLHSLKVGDVLLEIN